MAEALTFTIMKEIQLDGSLVVTVDVKGYDEFIASDTGASLLALKQVYSDVLRRLHSGITLNSSEATLH